MTRSYLNRWGVRYYLPDFGPPVRWIASRPDSDISDLPTLYYFECDGQNLGTRAIHVYADGRSTLAFPGGPDGDSLPEGPLPSVAESRTREQGETREVSEIEFNSIWAALSQTSASLSEPKALVDLTSSADPTVFKAFVGTWAPESRGGGLLSLLFLSANGLVVWKTDFDEVDVFKYRVERGVAVLSDSTGDKGEFEAADACLVLRMSGHEMGRFVRAV